MLVISENKFDESFLVSQFWIPGSASPFCLDSDQHSGGIMVFIREDIPAKFFSIDTKLMEGRYIEIDFQKKMAVTLLV